MSTFLRGNAKMWMEHISDVLSHTSCCPLSKSYSLIKTSNSMFLKYSGSKYMARKGLSIRKDRTARTNQSVRPKVIDRAESPNENYETNFKILLGTITLFIGDIWIIHTWYRNLSICRSTKSSLYYVIYSDKLLDSFMFLLVIYQHILVDLDYRIFGMFEFVSIEHRILVYRLDCLPSH